jgi:hypothetical protein
VTAKAAWTVGALAAVIVAGILTLVGQWSAGLELLVVAVILAVVAWRRR